MVDFTFDWQTPSAAATQQVGAALGHLLQPGDVLTLSGELGAGKTTFVTGLAAGWGAQEAVSSPTFVLVNEYRRPDGQALWHLDCYRLNTAQEALALGFDDLLEAHGVMVIEWPERIAAVLPTEHLALSLSWISPTARQLKFQAMGARAAVCLAALRQILSPG